MSADAQHLRSSGISESLIDGSEEHAVDELIAAQRKPARVGRGEKTRMAVAYGCHNGHQPHSGFIVVQVAGCGLEFDQFLVKSLRANPPEGYGVRAANGIRHEVGVFRPRRRFADLLSQTRVAHTQTHCQENLENLAPGHSLLTTARLNQLQSGNSDGEPVARLSGCPESVPFVVALNPRGGRLACASGRLSDRTPAAAGSHWDPPATSARDAGRAERPSHLAPSDSRPSTPAMSFPPRRRWYGLE